MAKVLGIVLVDGQRFGYTNYFSGGPGCQTTHFELPNDGGYCSHLVKYGTWKLERPGCFAQPITTVVVESGPAVL